MERSAAGPAVPAAAAAAIVHAPSRGGLITASIGLALNSEGQTPEQSLAAADQALYRAKQNGRNRVEEQA